MKYVFLFVLTSLSSSLWAQEKEFGWLVGTWQQENNKSFEEWKLEAGTLLGVGYTLDENGNRIVTEEIKLVKKDKDFFYEPDITGPKGEVRFRISALDTASFVAENPKHYFPQKIIYLKKDAKHMEVSFQKGTHRVNFFFTKLK